MLSQLTSGREAVTVPTPELPFKKLRVVLIKPSKYDDDGYVIRFWKGVLPSNTLNVLHGLTEEVKHSRVFGDLRIEIVTFDETSEKLPVRKIIRWSRRPSIKLVVGLVGVQTNQFPRAFDLARQFRAAGIDVIIGGFHTSGTINMLSDQEPDIQALVRESISVVSGEVEENWAEILADALQGRLKPIYSFAQDLQSLVDIGSAPLPRISPKTMRRFAKPNFGTADTSRGCPFACSFCTIINVQGRKMRERSPESIAEMARRNYFEHGITFYFFTDDNFARKKLWRETFEEIIKLRQEGIIISFMIQVDLARKPKDFVRLAAEAGCTQVFIGMESLNPENLKAEGKGQNHVEEYRQIINEWHDAGVVVHTGYIIGLPFDTKEQVPQDIRYLMDVIQPDQSSFFMLTPLPGSHDHREMKKRGEWMDPDFNKRDSFHATVKHPNMTAEEWFRAYQDAWKSFYSKENMIKILSQWNHNPKAYWILMSVFFWYKNAAVIEKEHPMIAGFFRLKDRLSRRPGFAIDPLPVHLWKRAKEVLHLFALWGKFLKEMEEVWLQSRNKSEKEEKWLADTQRIQGEIWQALKIAEWQKAYGNAKSTLPAKAKALLDPFEEISSKILFTRKDLNAFLRQWDGLQSRLQELRLHLNREGEAARGWLDEMVRIQTSTRLESRIQEWQEAYSRLRQSLPSKYRLLHAKFDALSNRALYSREPLQRFWDNTLEQLRGMRIRNIDLGKLTANLIKDFFLTTSFVFTYRTGSRTK
ncbi:MAG: radical SAM protein [Deltaproteobacteria bacterium]|nr:radical SAM protein [Deltaproteobacteria bacterium]MDZ4344913.1 radical SAM protein [Candidatus Binatia bacterium]